MNVGVGSLENGLAGFFERLLPGHTDICEQMWIVGEIAERVALPVPCPSQTPATQSLAEPSSPVILMTQRDVAGRPHDRG
jgi:hypothetical protein